MTPYRSSDEEAQATAELEAARVALRKAQAWFTICEAREKWVVSHAAGFSDREECLKAAEILFEAGEERIAAGAALDAAAREVEVIEAITQEREVEGWLDQARQAYVLSGDIYEAARKRLGRT